MKNPLKKNDHTALIAAAVIGGIATAALAYLFLTEKGDEILAEIKHKIKDRAKDVASGVISDKTGISKNTVKKGADIVAE